MGTGVSFPEREADHSSAPSAKVKNDGTILLFPIRPYGLVLTWLSILNVVECHFKQILSPSPLQVVDKRNGLQIWRVTKRKLNKQLRTADKRWSSGVGKALRVKSPLQKIITLRDFGQHVTCFTLVSGLAYSSPLKMEATCYSET
jgi:hypothetical protein